MLYPLARPLLFALDAERSHDLALARLAQAQACGLTRLLRPSLPPAPVHAMGLVFPNPVGLAAGLDKQAQCVDAFGDMGFGFIETGTVTPLPQPGNPKPRLFRLVERDALINRFGFNSVGLDAFMQNLDRHVRFQRDGGVIGINLGKNAATPLERALDDYVTGLRRVYPWLVTRRGYVTINVSSPNTRDLRDLQFGAQLQALLRGLAEARRQLADRHGARIPVAVKIAPDIDDADLRRVADALVEHGFDAVIATNTTVARDGVEGVRHATETGGLSGRPLFARSTAIVRRLAAHLQRALPIIGVGGILSGADAAAKIEAGATLVQLYTGLVYAGPSLVAECRRAIRALRSPSPGAGARQPA